MLWEVLVSGMVVPGFLLLFGTLLVLLTVALLLWVRVTFGRGAVSALFLSRSIGTLEEQELFTVTRPSLGRYSSRSRAVVIVKLLARHRGLRSRVPSSGRRASREGGTDAQ